MFSRKPAVAAPATPEPTGPVLGKGTPTPRRRDKEPRRGPVGPPPKTQREALKRAKTTGKSMTKEERKVAAASRRERMMRGDDAAVLPRDRGPVRRFVRDLVDARRYLAGLLLTGLVVSCLLSTVSPAVQVYAMLVMFVALLASIADSVILGRQVSRRVQQKFPKGDPTGISTKGFSLGYYAFNRAMLPRRWRAPRARTRPGEAVD
jgi:hypothetical protein